MADVIRSAETDNMPGSIVVSVVSAAIDWLAEPICYLTGRLVEFLLLRPARRLTEKIPRPSPARTTLAGLKLGAGRMASPLTPEGYVALGFFSLLAAGLIIAALWAIL